MEHHGFFPPHKGVRLSDLAARLGAELFNPDMGNVLIRSIAPVARGREGDLCYILSRRNRDDFATCQASAILCDQSLRDIVPSHLPILLSKHPHSAFAIAGGIFHPEALRPVTAFGTDGGIAETAVIHPTARLEPGVTVEPMAVIGPRAEIGTGTHIGAGSVIGPDVKIGRDCSIASGASILCALIGNHVLIHNGARIGQDGFGYAPGPQGMIKIVQIGRVIIQDHVEIGANTTIDRGTMDDTVIGEGTKIDNQVQIAHNCRIGRHAAIVSQVGIAGSTVVGDFVQIGGQAGLKGHIDVGTGAQIGAKAGVLTDVPAGERYAGIPARPVADFLRESAAVIRRAAGRGKNTGDKND